MKKNQKLLIVGASAVVASILTSCFNANGHTTETIESQTITQPSQTEVVIDTTEPTITESSSTITSGESYQRTNPLLDYALNNPDEYAYSAILVLHQDVTNRGIQYGFDNPYSISALQQLVYEKTGVLDNTLTLSDVNYFQYVEGVSNNTDSKKFSVAYSGDNYKLIYLEGVRAVMSSLGLRFGIDEIPTSYLYERFPRFFYDGYVYDADDKCFDNFTDSVPMLEDMSNICSTDNLMYRDWILYTSCLRYNAIRANYLYKNPNNDGVIHQERNPDNGMNELEPTDSQAASLQKDINSMPGCENIDIFTPETPEQFFEVYGYYPDDIVNSPSSVNTVESFTEYKNNLPDSENVEIIILKPSDFVTMYTYTASDDVYYVPDDYSGVYESATETEKGKGKSR